MNGYLAVGLILIIVGIYFMTNRESELYNETEIEDNNFCVKVKPFNDDLFCIVFSNDGFNTEIEYEEMLGDFEFGGTDIFHEKEEAIKVAETLKSYKQCLKHNKSVKDRTNAFHKRMEDEFQERVRVSLKNEGKRKAEEVIVNCKK